MFYNSIKSLIITSIINNLTEAESIDFFNKISFIHKSIKVIVTERICVLSWSRVLSKA